ncbi:MAG: hypothetical protein R8G01_00650 [Ilumatobacteraceae bacterium]|nr:hypothetical protein [Ilumatobacteraceae bacterium]
MESDLVEFDEEGRSPGDGDFEPVGVNRDGFDEFFDEHAAFFVVGVGPDVVEVEVGIAQECGGSFEGLCECVGGLGGFEGFGVVGFEGVDLVGDLAFLGGEVVVGDLVVEIQLEKPVAFPGQVGQRSGACRLRRPASGSLGLSCELKPDRVDQLVIGAQQLDAETCRAM